MNPNFSDHKLHLYDHQGQHKLTFSMRNKFSWHLAGLHMTSESTKYVNNPAEMVKSRLQCGAILRENGYRSQLEAMSHVILLLKLLGVATTLNYLRN